MFHPGGFGNSNKGNHTLSNKHEPSIIRPLLCMVGMLILWVLGLLTGLKLGVGWYAWPLGTVVLFFVFFVYNFIKFRSSDTR